MLFPPSTMPSYREQKVAKESRDEEIVAEDAVEEIGRQNVPCNGICNGRKDPVQLTLHRGSVRHIAYGAGVAEKAAQMISSEGKVVE